MASANTGYPPALFSLAFMYQEGVGVPIIYEEALRLHRLAARFFFFFFFIHINIHFNFCSPLLVFLLSLLILLYPFLRGGDVRAFHSIGMMYEQVSNHNHKRLQPRANTFFFFFFSQGLGVEQDIEKALKWYLSAAERFVVIALFLNFCTLKGLSHPPHRGHAPAQLAAALLLFSNNATTPHKTTNNTNNKEGLRLVKEAAEGGHIPAYFLLGRGHLEGWWGLEGGEGGEKEAVKWFGRAAEEGDVEGMRILGGLYREVCCDCSCWLGGG